MPSPTFHYHTVLEYLLVGTLVSSLVLTSNALPTPLTSANEQDLAARGPIPPKANTAVVPKPRAPAPKGKPLTKLSPKAPKGKFAQKKGLPPKRKTPAKKGSAAGPAGKSCPIKPKGNRLIKRSDPVIHPLGDKPMILFHGTVSTEAKAVEKIDLEKTHKAGDLHKKMHAFYLTDSVVAAAQFVCWRVGHKVQFPPEVHVLQYSWNPPAGLKVHNFKDLKSVADDKSKDIHLRTGPMYNPPTDAFLTKDFWQYALVDQDMINKGLTYTTTYKIPCKNVYKGRDLPSDDYTKGQGSNPDFSKYVQGLVDGSAAGSSSGC